MAGRRPERGGEAPLAASRAEGAPPPRSLLRAEIEIPAALADSAEEALLELGEPGWSLSEDAVSGRAWIVGIFPDRARAARGWGELRDRLRQLPAPAPRWRRLPPREWRDSYKAHFRPWRFGRLHWVPIWEKGRYRLPPGAKVVWLDPGMAFGTGNHETTRLCCRRLVEWTGSGRVLDAGCGSGILALSAARLGHRGVVGFDLDPVAVRVSRRNAAVNGLEKRAEFLRADLAGGLAGRPTGLVMANIQADVLVAHAPALVRAIGPGGSLVLSGILASELAAVRPAFAAAAPGWPARSRRLGEWCDLVLTRRGKTH